MTQDNPYLRRIRRLTQALIASGALNILLATLFVYWAVRERPPTPYFELKPADVREQQTPLAIDKSNSEVLRSFKTLPFEQLIAKLSSLQLVESGYTQRDLALAALIAFHYFDFSRALLGQEQPQQQRLIMLGFKPDGKPVEVTVYPGLTEAQWQAITQFAHRERWPLTAKGLFLKVRKQKQYPDTSLLDAFFLTPEFLSVETLFNRAEVPVDKNELLAVIRQGNWPMLASFFEQQKQAQDLSPARRQRFLLEYIERGSKAAVYLMLKTDGAYAVRKLDDTHIIALLAQMTEKTPIAERFALAVLTTPRSDAVWNSASERLYQYAGEPLPEKFQHHAALKRFLPKLAANKTVQVPVSPTKAPQPPSPKSQKEIAYVVQEGDSLWKISRRHKVEIDKIKAYNKLETDFLKPGTTLKIPL